MLHFQLKKLVLFTAVTVSLLSLLFAQDNRLTLLSGQRIFSSGMNMAWGHFANDATNLDEDLFIAALDELSEAGANTMRWWLHVNGTHSPQYANDTVSGISQTEIDNVRKILDLAYERGIVICISLWSHDMLNGQSDNYRLNTNQFMLADLAATKAYINNALIPLVDALKGHPGILCWEIFNEPEGMIQGLGWTGNVDGSTGLWTTYPNIKRFTNLAAGAIHRTDPEALVTTGTHKITYLKENYTDSVLINAGGDSLGTLDFYQAHYYSNFLVGQNPFNYVAAYFNLDKPIVIGEFSAKGPNSGTTPLTAYLHLYNNGYAGAWSWTWSNGDTHPDGSDGNGDIDDVRGPMQNLAQNHREDILLKIPGRFVEFEIEKTRMDRGDSVKVYWIATDSSIVTLNDVAFAASDTIYLSPDLTTEYELIAVGDFLADTVRFGITVLQWGEIDYFVAEDQTIEPGDSTLLSWRVVGDSSVVTLNGDTVASMESIYVKPARDTTFVLLTDGPVADSSSITLKVVEELALNRSEGSYVVASTFETCCGQDQIPEYAVDGNDSTRWSSAWSSGDPPEPNTDDDPNNEWIYVDLQGFYNIARVVLNWEAAFAESYNLEISSDAINWTVIDSVRGNDSAGIIEHNSLSGMARYVRMHGLNRATEWGYSIFEFEVYASPVSDAVVKTYADDFENDDWMDDGWAEGQDGDGTSHARTFELSESDGLLTVDYHRSAANGSGIWDQFNLTPLAAIDASENPIITLRVRSTVSTQLQLKPVYSDGGEDWTGLSANLSSDNQWRKLSFNLLNADASMNRIYFYFDGGSETASSGVVQFDYITIGTEIEDPTAVNKENIPLTYELANAYPNPFNPTTTIEFSLKKSQKVSLIVYNILGREIKTLFNGPGKAGKNNIIWDATDNYGNRVSTGIYFYRLQTETGYLKTKKVLLLK